MKSHCPLPAPNHNRHRLLVATDYDAVDDSDVTFATLTRFDDQYLRTAQVSAKITESRLLIQHLQGAGPAYSYRRAGMEDPKKLFDSFHLEVGLKPINTLLTALVLDAKEQGLEEAVWDGTDEFHLKPDAILHATKFRKNASGLFRLPLDTPEDKIIYRLVGRVPEKRALFKSIRERFRELLESITKNPQTLNVSSPETK